MQANIYESYRPLLESWAPYTNVVKRSIEGYSDVEATQLSILLENTKSEIEVSKGRMLNGTPVVEGTIKDIIGKWNAQDLIANREKATGDILFKLQTQLKDNYINVSDFQMTDINYSKVFEQAIESKVTAEQEALKAKNKTVQVQEEARQKVIAAEAEAKSMAIRAQALSQNKSLVQYEAVQKWDGKMPQYMMGNSVPFINFNSAK